MMKSLRFAAACTAAVWLAGAYGNVAFAQKRIEVQWADLPQVLDGRVVSTVLADGAVLKGRVLAVSPSELRFQVKKTSKAFLYPKGEVSIPRDRLAVFSYSERRGTFWRKVGTAAGGGGGFTLGLPLLMIANNEGGIDNKAVGLSLIPTGAGAALGYLAGHHGDTKQTDVFIARD